MFFLFKIIVYYYFNKYSKINTNSHEPAHALARRLLNNAGLESTQTSNQDLRIILENFLNGGMNTEFGTVMPL